MKIETHSEIKITIPLPPFATKAHNFRVVGKRAYAYTPTEKAEYMKRCLGYLYPYADWAVKGDLIKAVFNFYFEPKPNEAHLLWMYKSPDHDNLVKTVQDCLGCNIILRDKTDITIGAKIIWNDSQIVHCTTAKFFSKQPRIVIKLSKIRRPGELFD